MPLSDFLKTFRLRELKKGFSPHLFNTPANQNYRGRMPDAEHYMPDGMKPDTCKEFDTWHAEQVARGTEFHLKTELDLYCRSGVRLLKEGCLSFLREFQSRAAFDPFEQMTMASACSRYLRMHCLPLDTIASEPLLGWRGRVNHSKASMEWLMWQDQLQTKPGQTCPRTKATTRHDSPRV